MIRKTHEMIKIDVKAYNLVNRRMSRLAHG